MYGDPSSAEDKIIRFAHRLVFGLDRAADAILARHGASFRQFLVLTIIGHCSRDLSQRAVADFLALTPAAVSRTIDSLVEDGLAERGEDRTSRRAHRIRLTAAGKKELARCHRLLRDPIHERLATLSDKDKTHLAALLEKITDHTN